MDVARLHQFCWGGYLYLFFLSWRAPAAPPRRRMTSHFLNFLNLPSPSDTQVGYTRERQGTAHSTDRYPRESISYTHTQNLLLLSRSEAQNKMAKIYYPLPFFNQHMILLTAKGRIHKTNHMLLMRDLSNCLHKPICNPNPRKHFTICRTSFIDALDLNTYRKHFTLKDLKGNCFCVVLSQFN